MMALSVVSILCLFAHLARAAVLRFSPVAGAGAANGLEWAIKLLLVVCAVVGLVWIYRANASAQQLSGGLKYSPRAAVAWFFAPALNLIFSLSIMYDLWIHSGGPKRSLLLLVWWGFTAPSLYLGLMFLLAEDTKVMAQLFFTGAPLSFLILAGRITEMQRLSVSPAVFGDRPVRVEPEPIPADVMISSFPATERRSTEPAFDREKTATRTPTAERRVPTFGAARAHRHSKARQTAWRRWMSLANLSHHRMIMPQNDAHP